MKVIEKIIKYDDYNYVEGILQFKAYGHKTADYLHAEHFSIDSISSVRLEVEQKYLTPDLPPGINKNKVSTLSFLFGVAVNPNCTAGEKYSRIFLQLPSSLAPPL